MASAHDLKPKGNRPGCVYRAESNRSDILAVDWTEDIKVTSSICARRVTVSDAS